MVALLLYYTENVELDSDLDVQDVYVAVGENIVLPTEIMFGSSGSCRVHPAYTEVVLTHDNNEEIIACNISAPCVPTDEKPHNMYDFTALDDIVLPSEVGEGQYFFALRQCCPTSVIDRRFNVMFTSSGEPGFILRSHVHYVIVL